MATSTLDMDSPLGTLRLVSDGHSLTAVELPPHREVVEVGSSCAVLEAARAQLAEYFAGQRTTFDLPLAAKGTSFQRDVWQALRTIPHGETWSYAQLAAKVGRPTGARAVGLANSKNPLAIVVPCHRVIGADGSLTGYAGGLPAKRWLLAHEAPAAPAQLPLLASAEARAPRG